METLLIQINSIKKDLLMETNLILYFISQTVYHVSAEGERSVTFLKNIFVSKRSGKAILVHKITGIFHKPLHQSTNEPKNIFERFGALVCKQTGFICPLHSQRPIYRIRYDYKLIFKKTNKTNDV